LCDGQQLVAFGIHKDTGKKYHWHGGSPETILRQDLPYIHEQEAHDLVDAAVELLVNDFGTRTTVFPSGAVSRATVRGPGPSTRLTE
jgi:hypothetical protein